jgi:predicted PurR-regulated permease PerM
MPFRQSNHVLVALLLGCLGLFALILSGFAAPLILGTILATIARPAYEWISKNVRIHRNAAGLITVTLVSLVIILPAAGLLTLLTREAINLFTLLSDNPSFADPILRTLSRISQATGIDVVSFAQQQVVQFSRTIALTVSNQIGGLLSNFGSLILAFFVMMVTMFYLLRDGHAFATFLIELSPLKTKDELGLWKTFEDTGRAVFYGNVASALAQGILGGLGFALFGLSSPTLWGAVMGFLGLIPLLGPYLVFLPAAAYLFVTGKIALGIGFLAWNLILVSTIDNVLKPEIISSKIKVHPFVVLVSILGGLKLFGIMGLIYGPLIASLFLTLLAVYEAHVREHEPMKHTL